MSSFFDRLFGRQEKSAQTAKERMRQVLVHDRTDMSVFELDELKDELIGVVSRHVEIERSAVRLEMAQDGRQQRLIANIPIRPARRRRAG